MISKKSILVMLGASALCIGAGYYSKNISTAVDKYNTGEVSEEEKMLYNVSKNVNNGSENIYEDVSDIVAETTGEKKEEIKDNLEQNDKKRDELEKAAIDAGITVTEEEVDEIIKTTKEALHSDEDGSKQLQAVLSGSGLTEDEYWNSCRNYYKTSLLIEKYQDMQK